MFIYRFKSAKNRCFQKGLRSAVLYGNDLSIIYYSIIYYKKRIGERNFLLSFVQGEIWKK